MSVLDSSLNDRQREAVASVEGPLLIIAGAGSGKTRVITYRIARMLETGIRQSEILALTFTNKAAREMQERVRGITGRKLSNLTVSTFHSFGVQVLRDEIGKIGYKKNFSIYDQTDKMSLIKQVASELKIPRDGYDAYALAHHFSDVKTGRAGWTGLYEGFEDLYREYLDHCKLYNAVDFDDLIVRPIELFTYHPDTLEKYRAKFRYILVDEFQDTSVLQYELLRLLALEHQNLCVVGDDDQSIYSWRGADYRNIEYFEKDFPGRKEIILDRNYRSTENILSAANKVIANNTNRKDKALWTGSSGGSTIEFVYPENEGAEGKFIADTIKTLNIRDGYTLQDIGILVRTNSLTSSLEDALLANDIPYRVSGGTSFFERKEVKDLIAYMRVMANPDDDVNLLRIINTPRRGIGKAALTMLREIADSKGWSLYSAMAALRHAADSPAPARTRESFSELLDCIERYQELFSQAGSMSDALTGLIDHLGYWGYLLNEYHGNEKLAKFKYRNLSTFVQIMERWEHDPERAFGHGGVHDFLNRISLITRDDLDEEDGKGRVNLMTIHAAKGLEFEIVFLAGVEEGIIPHARALAEAPENIQEERRLFYVAITRAKARLYMTVCSKRRVQNDLVERSPSPFLLEIPTEVTSLHAEEEAVDPGESEDYFAMIKNRIG